MTKNTKKIQKKLWEQWWWSILISDSAVTAPSQVGPILTILPFVASALIDEKESDNFEGKKCGYDDDGDVLLLGIYDLMLLIVRTMWRTDRSFVNFLNVWKIISLLLKRMIP